MFVKVILFKLLLLYLYNFVFSIETHENLLNDKMNCSDYLTIYSLSSANFSDCIIKYARPVTICEDCVEQYIDLVNSYNNLTIESDMLGLCRDRYVDLDRLQVIKSTFDSHVHLWERAKCNNCFTKDKQGLPDQLSNDTLTFQAKFSQVYECILHEQKLKHDNETLCRNCMEAYVDLNAFYDGLKLKESDNVICMDIVDIMNSTRQIWSQDIKCCHLRQHKEYFFLISLSIALMLPILFYALTGCLSNLVRTNIVTQSRMAECLNSASSSLRR